MLKRNNLWLLTIPLGFIVLRKLMSSNTTNKKLSKNFDWKEFESKDGAVMPEDIKKNIQALVKDLEVIRSALGKPMRISSGYRSPAQNEKVGGKSQSYHMKGMAVDFYVPTLTTKQIRDVIETLISQGKIKQGGLGTYPTWVHYDNRGTKARW
jgi:uncharacterized protein YcbK (DUF882 family)